MKFKKYKSNVQFIFCIIILCFSCNSDNFYETQRNILSDKEEYIVGDNIEITFKITTIKAIKKVRFYENFKNIEISFTTFNDVEGNQNLTHNSGLNLKKTKIIERIITKNNPLLIKFKGKILETDDKIILSFPEINFKVSFNKKEVLKNDTSIRIHGFCNPINPEFAASLEEYFKVKDIKIKELPARASVTLVPVQTIKFEK